MNRHLHDMGLLLAGVVRHHGMTLQELVGHDEVRHIRRRRRVEPPQHAAVDEALTSGRFVQPMRFNRTRYEHMVRMLRGKTIATGVLVSAVAISMLVWQASGGGHVSPERWFLGIGSGWFIAWMVRLGLFAVFAAPRSLTFQDGLIRLSGLGALRPGHVSRWSLANGVMMDVDERPCSHLDIHCRWFGCDRRWTMFLNNGPEACHLRKMLEHHFPDAQSAWPAE
ncbi:MAG: hypothetical protein U1F71_21865 [Verrucomicrobiaceae bacterium]